MKTNSIWRRKPTKVVYLTGSVTVTVTRTLLSLKTEITYSDET